MRLDQGRLQVAVTTFQFIIVFALSVSTTLAQVILQSDTFDDPLFGGTFVEDGDFFWFSAVNFVEGGELWVSDGSPAGTVVVGEATPGTAVEFPFETIAFDGKAFFLLDGDQDVGLWMSDGTPNGLLQLSSHAVASNADKNVAVNGIAYVNGVAIAFADTALIAIEPSNGDTTHILSTHGSALVQGQTFVYAFATNPTTGAGELLKTDGTSVGTVVLANISFENENQIGIIGDKLIFVANDFSGSGEELFVSDGTINGSGFLPEFLPGDEDIACADIQPGDGTLYLGLLAPNELNCKPYQTDGSFAGTVPVADTTGINVYGMSEAAGLLYYWENAVNLWRTDGTLNGTIKLATLDGTGVPVVEFANAAWFAGFEGAAYNLWRSDGTPAGTQRYFSNPIATIDPLSLTVIGDRLYFSAFDTYYIESVETGVEQLVDWKTFELESFPNPANGDVTLLINASSGTSTTVEVSVYDILGRIAFSTSVIKSSDSESIALPLKSVSPGIYIVKVDIDGAIRVETIIRQ